MATGKLIVLAASDKNDAGNLSFMIVEKLDRNPCGACLEW